MSNTPLLEQLGLQAGAAPKVMGILNCTPDSFFEGSRKQTEREIAERATEILRQGGSIIDIGAFSTRPGAQEVSQQEEMARMKMALEVVRREVPDATLSIDTYRPLVARMAVEEYGAQIINDVSEGGLTGIVDKPLTEGGRDADGVPEIFREVARLKAAYLLMSVQPTVELMIDCFRKEVDMLHNLGVSDIILDPGYGFGKDVIKGNFEVLARQREICEAFPTLPLLAGMSRKRMVWQLLGCTAQDDAAMHGTMLADLLALERGATLLRVHDVKEAVDTIRVYEALRM